MCMNGCTSRSAILRYKLRLACLPSKTRRGFDRIPGCLQHKLWPLQVDHTDGLSWRNDGNTFVLSSQGKQMPVSGDDPLGLAGEGASEHMIIIGIVFDHAGHLGGRHHRHQGALADSQY